MTIEEEIIKYAELNEQAKQLSTSAALLNAKIKIYMSENHLSSIDAGDVTAVYSVQERTSTLTEKMIERLRALGLEEGIKMVETLDEAKIQDMIYEKRLTPQQIEDCIEIKPVEVLKISKNKKSKSEKSNFESLIKE